MKKLFLLTLIVAFALVGTQAFASPPVKPPVEGFIITSNTIMTGTGDFTESERYNWTYFEGWGKGPFYPDGYTPVPGLNCYYNGAGECIPTNFENAVLVSERGFTEGAEIAYQQTFNAVDVNLTLFKKTFEAYSNPDAAALQDNLMVDKQITLTAIAGTQGFAEHTEKVGLSVISMGAKGASEITNPAEGLLSLCPWAADSGGALDKGYPPTNEGIAAGSHFKVTEITGFVSKSRVNSTKLPMLSYDVTATQGKGFIEAGFVVELWEGPEGFVWEPLVAGDHCINCELDCGCNPRSENEVYALPGTWGPPPLASRTSYKEYASADGTWAFTKNVKYQSVMPGAASGSTFPFNQVFNP